jgi:serine/threonine-protein phosphatase 2A activator
MHVKILSHATEADIAPELLHHFKTSFGSFPRIDYGSGHELSFFAYLCLLQLGGILPSTTETTRALVSRIYPRYLDVCLQIQKVYRLEPAGSKGVWGLDDYKFLSYLFGASQLLGLKDPPRVSTIAQKLSASSDLARSNLFFLSLAQISELKSGPFFEHSPVLYNISQTVPNWTKVHRGLEKMYEKEVLEKWPVVQHFYFGKWFSWTDDQTGGELPVNALAMEKGGQDEDEEAAAAASVLTKAPWVVETPAPWANNNASLR